MYGTSPQKIPTGRDPNPKIYKILPDASRANLPPRPVNRPPRHTTPPPTPGPSVFRSPGVFLTPSPTPSPKKISHDQKATLGQKRKYSQANDSVVAQFKSPFLPQKPKAPARYQNNRCDGPGEMSSTERPAKIQRTDNNSTIDRKAKHQQPPDGTTIPQEHPIIPQARPTVPQAHPTISQEHLSVLAKIDTDKAVFRLIQDKLLAGATTLTARNQETLRRHVEEDLPHVSPLILGLIGNRVMNKTHKLSYAIVRWAQRNGRADLLENMLIHLLYDLDPLDLFNERLMDMDEMLDLMDCQDLLNKIRDKRTASAEDVLATA
ncbi:hypothetical protein F4777DRAFT_584807 [Nemania sp. FL0916]|nr:hypothetical protein F4777DRAFT_584807 [Nemania sp. FL0916]